MVYYIILNENFLDMDEIKIVVKKFLVLVYNMII